MSTEKPLNIAVIQLTRIGDIVQTIQATRQFKAENPNIKLTLIAHKKFAAGLKFLIETVFDELILIETKDFFQTADLEGVKSKLTEFVQDLNKHNFDVTVNLSFSKSSSYLNHLIKSKLTLGLARNNKSEIVINDKWSQYVYSNVMNSSDTPFCLVDIYRYILGCNNVHKLSDDPQRIVTKSIVLHPFASERKKRWGINRWTELIFKLSKDCPDHEIHIVGGNDDVAEAERLLESPALADCLHRIHNNTGVFKLSDTYQALQRAELFIGHDSVVSHIASETLTPTIVLSLGTVRPHETTAYNENVINIAPRNKCYPCKLQEKCDLLPCHNSISFQSIAAIGLGLIKKEEINYEFLKSNISPFQLDSIAVYKSEYAGHGLDLVEISSTFDTTKDVFKSYYKIIWQLYLRDEEINTPLPDVTKETADHLQHYQEGLNNLFDLYNFGVKFSNRIITECALDKPKPAVIKESIEKLTEIDQLCNTTKKSYPHLAGLVDYFFVHKANSEGDDILGVAQAHLLAYYDASNLVAVLNDFVAKSVSPYMDKNINKEQSV